jgi:prepilin-type N-terminal cleavage/methylation domain-containing protein
MHLRLGEGRWSFWRGGDSWELRGLRRAFLNFLSPTVSRMKISRRAGFTLIEALVATTVLALCGAAVLLGLSVSLQTTTASMEETLGIALAQQMMDEIAGARYHDVGGSPTGPLGASAAEKAGPGRRLFDSIDDYDKYNSEAASAPTDFWGVELGSDDGAGGQRHPLLRLPAAQFVPWRRKVTVAYVDINNPSSDLPVSSTSDYRAVQVVVKYTDPETGDREVARMRRVFANIPH